MNRLFHCNDGSPLFPACRETALPLDSHNVSSRTRSCDLYSDNRCQTVVFSRMGASADVPKTGSRSNVVRLRGRKSVDENVGAPASFGRVKISEFAMATAAVGGDCREPATADPDAAPGFDACSSARASPQQSSAISRNPGRLLSWMVLHGAAVSRGSASLNGRHSGMGEPQSQHPPPEAKPRVAHVTDFRRRHA